MLLKISKIIFAIIILLSLQKRGSANQWFSLGNGFNQSVYAVEIHNGKITAGGDFNIAGGGSNNYIGQWTGTTWAALGSGLNDKVLALRVFNGELIAGGNFTNSGATPVNRIAKFNGTSWTALGSGINGDVYVLIVFGGELIAAGNFSTAGGQPANNIAKWNGTSWSALGSGLNDKVRALAIHGGSLYAGGDFDNSVARWNGSSWTSVGSSLDKPVYALASYNSLLFAGGDIDDHLRQWNGTSWSKSGGGLDDRVYSLIVSQGELIAGGEFKRADPTGTNQLVNYIAKWNNSVWSGISSGMDDEVYALTGIDAYSIVAGGKFKKAGGVSSKRIAYTIKSGSISGVVKYMSGQPVTSGTVKAVRMDPSNRKIIVSDSSDLQPNGTYNLRKVPQIGHHVLIFPDDELDNYCPTFYPSTIDWHLSPVIIPDSITTGVNITVFSQVRNSHPGKIKGKVKLNFNLPPIGDQIDSTDHLADAIIYIKSRNTFRGFSISNSSENYEVSSLPQGDYEVIVNRLGYTNAERRVTLSYANGYTLDSVNFTLDTSSTVTIVNNTNEIPNNFKLHQNYPNPFNPSTKIQIDMSRPGNVRLTIHDILGRKVTELVNEYKDAGIWEINWNAGNLSGGVYFYRLEVSETSTPTQNTGYIETKKMLLVK